MASERGIEELLDLWEEQQEQGDSRSSEEFVRQFGNHLTPEQIAELYQAIGDLKNLESVLGSAGEASTPGNEGSDTTAPSRAGQTVSVRTQFRVTRLHARGGLGEVYVADDGELGREVAFKVIQPTRSRLATSRSRFLREARLTSQLQHPGIVPVYGCGEDDAGVPFYVMRFVSGRTLQEAVQDHYLSATTAYDFSPRGMSFQQLLRRFIAVCETVAYAHSRGVLHRDLKPSNILMGGFGETIIIDWGLAKAGPWGDIGKEDPELSTFDGGQPVTATSEGAVIGTPAFMSPEQAAGKIQQLGPASDVYSLGAVLYSILTGHPPFGEANPVTILRQVQEGRFLRPCMVNVNCSRALEAVCLKAMAIDPADRYASALDLSAEVERWLAHEPVSAWQDSWLGRLQRWQYRHRKLVPAATAIFIVALVILFIVVSVYRSQSDDVERKSQVANREKEVANKRFERARHALAGFVSDLTSNPRLQVNEPGTVEARRILLDRARKYYEDVLEEKSDDPSLRADSARDCFQLAYIQLELQLLPEALAQHEKALALYLRLPPEMRDRREVIRDLGYINHNIGWIKHLRGDYAGAVTSLVQARTIQERLHQNAPLDLYAATDLGWTNNKLGLAYRNWGRFKEAEACYQKSLVLFAELVRQKESLPSAAMDLGGIQLNLAILAYQQKQYERALELYDQSIQTLEGLRPSEPIQQRVEQPLGNALRGRINTLGQLHQYAEASAGAEKLTARWQDNQGLLYELACVFARLSASAQEDTTLEPNERAKQADAFGKRGVEMLTKAHQKGFFRQEKETQKLADDPALRPLRTRSDFQKLVERISGK